MVVDGRDIEELCQVFWQAAQMKNKPTAVVAKTFKGRGVPSKEVLLLCLGLLASAQHMRLRLAEQTDS